MGRNHPALSVMGQKPGGLWGGSCRDEASKEAEGGPGQCCPMGTGYEPHVSHKSVIKLKRQKETVKLILIFYVV